MRSGAKNSNEEEDYGEEEQNANQNGKDGESKATATRSKHSLTEQKRRSKINERYQQLRGLIPQPNSEQKKDTASFLLEVIDYVQYLQGELQKYEGTYQPWNSEPTKLMPWRNNHWRTQGTALRPLENDVGAGFPENLNDATQSMLLGHLHEFSEPDALSNPTSKAMDQQMHLPMQTLPNASENDTLLSHHLQQPISDSQSADPPLAAGALSQRDGLAIESGTISISSTYSQGLLNTLKDALQRAGVDLSQAHISVQIDLGKRANRGPAATENYSNLPSTHPPPSTSIEDLKQAQKRLKTSN